MPTEIKGVLHYSKEEVDTATTAAVKDVKTKLTTKYDAQISELTGKLTTLETKAQAADALQTKVAELETAYSGQLRTSQITTAARAAGIPDALITSLVLNHKAIDTLDLSQDGALNDFLTPFKALGTATPTTQTQPTQTAGVSGSPTGGTKTAYTVKEVEAFIQADPHWLDDAGNKALAGAAMRNG